MGLTLPHLPPRRGAEYNGTVSNRNSTVWSPSHHRHPAHLSRWSYLAGHQHGCYADPETRPWSSLPPADSHGLHSFPSQPRRLCSELALFFFSFFSKKTTINHKWQCAMPQGGGSGGAVRDKVAIKVTFFYVQMHWWIMTSPG